jgi:hypothetical protein
MSRFKRLKKSPRVLLGTALCCDCGVDTTEAGDIRAVHSQRRGLESRGMQPGAINSNNELIGGGFLCVGCIEKRLGRRLTIDDITPICIPLALGSPWNTERLRSRMLYRTQEEEDAAKIREPIEWTADFCHRGIQIRDDDRGARGGDAHPLSMARLARPQQMAHVSIAARHEVSRIT